MEKGNEKETGIPEITPEVSPDKTPTQEEVVAQLTKEKDDALAKADEKEKGFKTLQAESQRKIRQLEERGDEIDAVKAQIDVLGGMMLNKDPEASLDDVPPERKVDLAKQYQKAVDDSKFSRQVLQRQERVEALGLPETDPNCEAIKALTLTGNFKRADALLDELEKAEAPSKTKEPQKSPEEIKAEHEAEVEEKARKMLEEKGLLKSDTGEPSGPGGALTPEQVKKMSPEERFEKREEIAKMPMALGKK